MVDRSQLPLSSSFLFFYGAPYFFWGPRILDFFDHSRPVPLPCLPMTPMTTMTPAVHSRPTSPPANDDCDVDSPLRPVHLYCLDHDRRVVVPIEFTVADDANLSAAIGRKHAKYDPWLLRNPCASIARLVPRASPPHSQVQCRSNATAARKQRGGALGSDRQRARGRGKRLLLGEVAVKTPLLLLLLLHSFVVVAL